MHHKFSMEPKISHPTELVASVEIGWWSSGMLLRKDFERKAKGSGVCQVNDKLSVFL